MNNSNSNNDDNFDKKLEQISKIISRISVIACLLIGILFSLFLMIAYGVPLSGFERDMKKVELGVLLLSTLLFSMLLWKGIDILLSHLKKGGQNFTKEINPKKWPSPSKRTVKNILIYMSRKTGLLIWDILTICVVISYILAFLLPGTPEIEKNIIFGLEILVFFLVIRIIFMLYYRLRNYVKSMLKHYDFYGGRLEHSRILDDLEESLKNRMLYYSPQWIITEDFFLAWCKELFFAPIAIPIKEMHSLRFEVRKGSFQSGRRYHQPILNNIIVCQLKSGQSVELYIGNKLKAPVILKVLRYFNIPFDNALEPREGYLPPYEITVTPPGKASKQNTTIPSVVTNITNLDRSIFTPVMNKITQKDMETILNLLASGRKIQGIKEIMNATGIGLAEAKKIADQYYVNHPEKKLN